MSLMGGGKAMGAPRLRLRIDLGPRRVGPGKIAILEAIAREGSISAAARGLRMSYRRAWELVEDLNATFGRPVVAASAGGSRGGGARLTPLGEEVITCFRAAESAATEAAAPHLARLAAQGWGGEG